MAFSLANILKLHALSLTRLYSSVAFCTSALLSCVSVAEAVVKQTFELEEGQTTLTEYSWPESRSVAVLAAVILCLLLAFAVFSCTDCYKSEVSSECHPAAASNRPHWGGAGDYSAAVSSNPNDRVLGAGFTAEIVSPAERVGTQNLPYTVIPAQVPEAQGFTGYVPAGQAGYGSTGGVGARMGTAPAIQGHFAGAHVSATPVPPWQDNEPPPSYSAIDPYH